MRNAAKDLAMCEAATPGPWKTSQHDQYSLDIVSVPEQEVICWTDSFGQGARDGYFIAEAREALPYWIKRAMAAEAEIDQLRKEHHLDRIELNRRIMKLETENTRMVVLAGAGYEKLVRALQLIAEESEDIGSVACAQETLKELGLV
ncbi:hypothetical protein ABE205_19460 [Brevibacillus agri]|uniref:hypothetical protein n=1 Tax=Brevibacillus agri TaxID=51101 RepID=UPI003D20E537